MSGPDQAQGERARLSALLRGWRVRAGLTSQAAATRAGFSQSKLSKIETGMLLPSESDVRGLCRVYRSTSQQREEVVDLVRRLQNEVDSARVILQRGAYRKQQQIGRIEARATTFRDFQPAYLIGLLQTPAYMRRIFAGLSPDEIEPAIQARLTRQGVLRDTTKQFNLIMTEGALRWLALPPNEMITQLDHIAQVAELPHVRVGIIAWTTPVTVFPGHAFHIYDEDVVIVGTVSATATIRDPRDVRLYTALFTKLEELAVYGAPANAVLHRIRTEIQHMT